MSHDSVEDLKVRMANQAAEIERMLMDALAEAWKGDDLPGQLEAARGDLRVERERADMLEKKLSGQQSNVDEAQRRAKAYKAERDEAYRMLGTERTERNTLAVRVKELEGALESARRYANGLEAWGIHPLVDPDKREMPFNSVTMAPPDTCDQSLTAALIEAYRNASKWRTRAQKCQQALRRIRVLTEDMSFALDEDWGADDDS